MIALSGRDLDGDMLNIQYSQETKTEGRKPTKTKSRRKVQVDSYLLHELNELKANNKSNEWLFGDDSPLATTTLDRVFAKAIKDSGVKRIRIHDLRHSHATWLINNGVNIVAVSKRLGHATIEQTLATYTHLLSDTNEQLISFIEEYKK